MKRAGDDRHRLSDCVRGVWHLVVGALMLAGLGTNALAQITVTPEQLQQQQQQLQRGMGVGTTTTPPPNSARETILEPTAPSAPQATSEIERLLSARAGVRLQMFGYDQLGVGRSVALPQVGAVQDDYILGVGDEVVLTMRGQENSEYRAMVDRDGNVTFPRLNPVSAAGRTLGKFREDLVAAIHRAYVTTSAFVTVGRIRQISVLVSGEVGSPGVRTLTGLSTVVDALFVSGGVKKSGSLRNIRVLRDGRELPVDLYSVLIGGVHSKNIILADGDKVVVPSVGPAVAVAGELRRPGIYELPAGRAAISVREAVALASGPMVRGAYRVSLMRIQPDGQRHLVDVTDSTGDLLHDSEIVLVQSSNNISFNQVTLTGAVRAPGSYALGKYKTLHDIISSPDSLEPGAYMLFGIVIHLDRATLVRSAIPFSPLAVIQGKTNMVLASDDEVRILTKDDVNSLIDLVAKQQDAKARRARNEPPTPERAPRGPVQLPRTVPSAGTGRTEANGAAPFVPPEIENAVAAAEQPGGSAAATTASTAPFAPAAPGAPAAALAATVEPAIAGLAGINTTLLGKTIADYRVFVSGAVHEPGIYLVIPGTTISDLLVVAGGLVDNVDLTTFELTSTTVDNANGTSTTSRAYFPATPDILGHTLLKAYDRLTFREVYSDKSNGSITIDGEVRYPGSFDILRSEKLSSVLQRAGGFTDVAYPEGTVFLRTSVARAEEIENQRTVNDLHSQLLTYLTKPQQNGAPAVSGDTIAALQALITQTANAPALGRVPVVASLSDLQKHPELDIILEPGDAIVIPRRPSTVLVMGEVMRPGAQRFMGSSSADSYVDMAGGTTEQADSSRIVVVLPDGSVRTGGSSWLNFGSDSDIPAGSTVYVPRKLEITNFRQILTDTIQIVSQLATTAAALAVLSKQ